MQSHRDNREKGRVGEAAACKYVEKKGFCIIDRNFSKYYGELDIVATKDGFLHFFEVKSITEVTNTEHRPEENVHNLKTHRLKKVISAYIEEKDVSIETQFEFHVICVYMNKNGQPTAIKWMNNIII